MTTGGVEDIVVGWVAGAHGIHGEIKVKPASPGADNLRTAKSLWMGFDDGEGSWFRVRTVQDGRIRGGLKLEGIDDCNRAESLKGNVLKIRREDCKILPGGSYYLFELIGLTVVTVAGQVVGPVKDVMMLPAQPVLVVGTGGKEVLDSRREDVHSKSGFGVAHARRGTHRGPVGWE